MTAAIECRELTSGYKGVPAVRALDLHVEAGEIVALLGPNGAGKTTTLLTLSGVLSPISGGAFLFGDRIAGGRPHIPARKGVVHVPDDRALFFGLTTLENLKLGVQRWRGAEHLKQVLAYFPALESRLNVRAGLLSGGEQQMLAMGRALLRRPRAMLLDEMSLGLAPVIVKSLLPTVRTVAEELGTAVLLVEQHVELALGVADRAYVLNRGEVALAGPAAQLVHDRDLLRSSYLGTAPEPQPQPAPDGSVPSGGER
jgi:branched-chain amino acid transport system ATP-binding protein